MLSAKETCLIAYNISISCNQTTEVCVVLHSWAWSILTMKKEYTVYKRTFGFNNEEWRKNIQWKNTYTMKEYYNEERIYSV